MGLNSTQQCIDRNANTAVDAQLELFFRRDGKYFSQPVETLIPPLITLQVGYRHCGGTNRPGRLF